MAGGESEPPLDLGLHGRAVRRALGRAETVAIALSLVWLAAVGAWFWLAAPLAPGAGGPGRRLEILLILLAVMLPLALIWIGAWVARTAAALREESRRLQLALARLERARAPADQADVGGDGADLGARLAGVEQAARRAEAAVLRLAGGEPAAPDPADPEQRPALPDRASAPAPDEPALALASPDDRPRPALSVAEFIRAVNFPEDEHDAEGFRTLRRALQDRELARMIRAAQDVLTLLSHDGVYMDDLRFAPAGAGAWRAFARGERGPEVAALAGARDRSALALARGRMRADAVFRDAAMHFLRQFDRVLGEFVETATDADLEALEATRSARAFRLLGQVAGSFE